MDQRMKPKEKNEREIRSNKSKAQQCETKIGPKSPSGGSISPEEQKLNNLSGCIYSVYESRNVIGRFFLPSSPDSIRSSIISLKNFE
jgi:hypothetical protein